MSVVRGLLRGVTRAGHPQARTVSKWVGPSPYKEEVYALPLAFYSCEQVPPKGAPPPSLATSTTSFTPTRPATPTVTASNTTPSTTTNRNTPAPPSTSATAAATSKTDPSTPFTSKPAATSNTTPSTTTNYTTPAPPSTSATAAATSKTNPSTPFTSKPADASNTTPSTTTNYAPPATPSTSATAAATSKTTPSTPFTSATSAGASNTTPSTTTYYANPTTPSTATTSAATSKTNPATPSTYEPAAASNITPATPSTTTKVTATPATTSSTLSTPSTTTKATATSNTTPLALPTPSLLNATTFSAATTTAAGDAEDCPVVFLHELFGSKEQWTTLCRRLHATTGRKTIAFDLRNHGDSPHSPLMTYRHLVADLSRALEEHDLGSRQVSLVGHRMGGRVAMALALDNPGRVRDLVVVDVSPRAADHNVFEVPLLLDAMHGARLRPAMTCGAARRSLARQLAIAVRDPHYRELLLDNVVRTANGEYKWRVNLVAVALNFPEVAMPVAGGANHFFDGPTLFVTGTRHARSMRVERVDIRRTFSKAEFKAVKNVRHILHYKREDDLIECLITFHAKQRPMKSTVATN